MRRASYLSLALFIPLLISVGAAAQEGSSLVGSGGTTPGGLHTSDTVIYPSPLAMIAFEFDAKDELGSYPYNIELAGPGGIDTSRDPVLTRSGIGSLRIPSGEPTSFRFAIPVETIEFWIRAEHDMVKPTVKGFDVAGERVWHWTPDAVGWTQAFFDDIYRPIVLVTIENQTTVGDAAIDELVVRPREAATSFCVGDGSSGTCPCANQSASGSLEGCLNSSGRGARMHALGTNYAGRGDLRFHVLGIPAGQPVMLLEGSQNGLVAPFRDGLFCLGHVRRRLDIAFSDVSGMAMLGSETFEGALAPLAGESHDYQCWFRDPAVSVCGLGSGFSQAQHVDFH